MFLLFIWDYFPAGPLAQCLRRRTLLWLTYFVGLILVGSRLDRGLTTPPPTTVSWFCIDVGSLVAQSRTSRAKLIVESKSDDKKRR